MQTPETLARLAGRHSTAEFAAGASVSVSALHMWHRGDRRPYGSTLARVHHALARMILDRWLSELAPVAPYLRDPAVRAAARGELTVVAELAAGVALVGLEVSAPPRTWWRLLAPAPADALATLEAAANDPTFIPLVPPRLRIGPTDAPALAGDVVAAILAGRWRPVTADTLPLWGVMGSALLPALIATCAVYPVSALEVLVRHKPAGTTNPTD